MAKEDRRLLKIFREIPDTLKGWISLIVSIAALVAAIRSEASLFTLISLIAILTVILGVSLYLVFSRFPSSFGGKGAYRYEKYRGFAFTCIGIVAGFVLAFVSLKPNREYVSKAFLGPRTPTQSLSSPITEPSASPVEISLNSTATPSVTAGLTATLTPPPPSMTPTLTPTSTPTPTRTPAILFQDDFKDNARGWDEGVSLSGSDPTYNRSIIGGKLSYSLKCGPDAYSCEDSIPVPFVKAKDFRIDFDATITELSRLSKVSIGIKFRLLSPRNFYVVYFSSFGTYRVILVNEGRWEELQEETASPIIHTDIGAVNNFGVIAKGSEISVLANQQEIIHLEDGNINQVGTIMIGLQVSKKGATKVEFDNIVIKEVQ